MTSGNPPTHELEPVAPPELCVSSLLDMRAVVGDHATFKPGVGSFYRSMVTELGGAVPDDLATRLEYKGATEGPLGRYAPQWASDRVVGELNVGFDSWSVPRLSHSMFNIDFVNTEDGLKAYVREPRQGGPIGGNDGWWRQQYVYELNDAQLIALAGDAAKIREQVLELDMERMKLGPLVEGPDEFGRRNFHIGDVLSVMLDRDLSPRGLDGNVDILRYLRGGRGISAGQINELRQHFAPKLLDRYGKEFEPYFDALRSANDYLTVYKILNEIQLQTGITMLAVDEAAPSDLKHESAADAVKRLFPEIDNKQIDVRFSDEQDEE